MKKNYTTFLIAILFCGSMIAQEQQKNFINYQGVARNANNELMASESMNLGLAVRFGASNAAIAYEETHDLTTDANGVFSIKIGNGNTVSGDYNNLSWGSGAAYITVSINGSIIGTTELMAVPYAISSGDADDQTAAEVAYDNSVSNLSATTTQAAIDELVGSGTVDADPDPTNELQTLSFDTNTNEISLTDGGTITIPSGGTDADADPTNEFQNLSFDTNTNELSLSDGNSITIPSGGTDADADPTNEFQNLSFDTSTNELSLSDGNTVMLPSGGTDADADPTNELQDISLSGTNLSISDGSTIDLAPIVPPGGTDDQNLEITGDVLSIENGTGSVDLSTYRDDNDADPANEFQTLNFDSNTSELSLSDGNTVTLPNGGGGGTDDQNLELNGDVLSIENGNGSVDLSTYRDDNDADPTNEHQTLSFDSNTSELSLSDGNTITLPNSGGAGATSIDELSDGKSDGFSVFLGENAGANDEGINKNVGVGHLTLNANTSGANNTAIGFQALSSNIFGVANTAIGGLTLRSNSGSYNTANGFWSLQSNTTGSFNTGLGVGTLQSNTTGELNTAIGADALYFNTTGFNNTAVGRLALGSNTTGINNTANGFIALISNTTGGSNSANGAGALSSNTIGSANTANGFEALKNNTEGFENVANGVAALYSNTTGRYNAANGVRALLSNTTGESNTANGYEALRFNVTGTNNTANGSRTLFSNETGVGNVANGVEALFSNTTGLHNTANGYLALYSNTTGGLNTASGYSALHQNTIGSYNTANGKDALFQNTTGTNNTAEGQQALYLCTTGNYNTALGSYALSNVGTGSNNVGIGADSEVPNGNNSNQVRIGNDQITYAGIQVPWTVPSDSRWKEKIQDLPYGLNMVSQLHPVDYMRKNNENKTREIGFIAQEVELLLDELGYEDQGILAKDDKGYLSVRYNDFIPVLTKAIQEQQEMITSLQSEQKSTRLLVLELKAQINELVGNNNKIEATLQK